MRGASRTRQRILGRHPKGQVSPRCGVILGPPMRWTWARSSPHHWGAVMLLLAALAGCSGSSAARSASSERLADRAGRVCSRYRPEPPGWISSGSSATTVAEQLQIRRRFHQDTRPLRDRPPGQFLAICSYIPVDLAVDRSPTIPCPNGDSVSTFEPKMFLIDEAGRAIRYPVPPSSPTC